jgi:prepilin-type N-terminal cleavage/methylation domain-containing protein
MTGMMTTNRRPVVDDDGFTLIEMMIAIALSAFVLLALGMTLAGALRTLGVAKGRAQGNEVATQAIEDLQRYPYGSLATCGAPVAVANPPAAASDAVVSTSSTCPSGAAAKPAFGDQPCLSTPALTGIPAATYNCARANRSFDVNRYVAWTDAGHSAKRMAVLVTWTDDVGSHTVSQQSSLRAPVTGDIVGIAPPGFDAVANNPSVSNHSPTIASTPGPLTGSTSVVVSVTTTGLTDTVNDRVFAAFTVIDASGEATTASFLLGSPTSTGTDKLKWTGTLVSGSPYLFPAGSQYLTFTSVRASDGKTGSTIDATPTVFCPAGGCPVTPTFTSNPITQPSSTITIDGTGALATAGLSLTATTKLLGPEDRVLALVLTRSGLVTVAMVVDTTAPCSADPALSCKWTGAVTAPSGYAFDPGPKTVYFTGLDTATSSATAAASNQLTFSVAS